MEIITKLEQYYSMKQEAKDLRQRIEAGERYLVEMEKEGCQVSDTVTGTRKDGTIGAICVTGFPIPEYEKIKTMTKKRIARLKILEEELMDFINKIPKSELRMIFRLYYIDDYAWFKVAHVMNGRFPKRKNKYTADSCRMLHNRYLEKIEKN